MPIKSAVAVQIRRSPRASLWPAVAIVAGLVALSVSVVPQAAHAATVDQVQVFGPGSGGFRIPQNATNISVTLASGEGWGINGSGGKGGSLTLTLASSAFAGVPVQYQVGAAGEPEVLSGSGDDAVLYRGGGGATAISISQSLLVVVGGGGGSGASLAGDVFLGGNGGVPDSRHTRDASGDHGQGPGINASGGGGGEEGSAVLGDLSTFRGGTGGAGRPAGQPGQDSINRFPQGQDFVIASGGLPGVASPFSACGGGGEGFAGGGGGGDARSDGCGAGGGGSGVFRSSNSSVQSSAAGLNTGDGSLTLRFSIPELVVTPPTLPVAQDGVAFVTDAISVTGGAVSAGQNRYRFAITSGTLPDGVDFSTPDGRIGGTPTEGGVFPFTVTVTDAVSPAPQSVDIPLTLTVQPAPLSLMAAGATGRVGQPLSWSPATRTGGAAPFAWSIHSGALPPGTTLDPATGVVAGLPTAAATYTVALHVEDSWSPIAQADSAAATLVLSTTPITGPGPVRQGATGTVSASGLVAGQYAIYLDDAQIGTTTVTASGALSAAPTFPADATVGAHQLRVLYQGVEVGRTSQRIDSAVLTATALAIPDARQGESYSAAPVAVTGGLAPLTYTSIGGMPAGLTVDPASGTITGTPTVFGTFSIQVQVEDAETPGQVASATVALTIAPVVPVLTTTPLHARQGQPYSAEAATVAGGVPPFTYALIGSAPPGLTLDPATGSLSGVPTTTGTTTFRIAVTDSYATPQREESGDITLDVAATPLDAPAQVEVGDATSIGASDLVAGTYQLLLDTTPIGSGTVESDGTLTVSTTIATDTVLGPHEFVVTYGGVEVGRSAVTVVPATLQITTVGTSTGHVGVPYAATPVSVVHGAGPYTFTLGQGEALPDGLSLDASTGRISGTPTAASAGDVAITVTDSSQTPQSLTRDIALTIEQLTIDVTDPAAVGGPIEVTGDDFDTGTYTVELHSDPVTLGTATVGGDGALRFRASVPGAVDPGVHEVRVLLGGSTVATASVTITTAGAASADPGALAGTGFDSRISATTALLALILLACGVAVRSASSSRPRR